MLKGVLTGIAATSVVAVIGGYFVLQSGIIPANADTTPGAIETWAPSTPLSETLERDALKVKNPMAMTKVNLVAGIDLHSVHCAIYHGIYGTAIPLWKDTLSDQQIWTIALVLKNMIKLRPALRESWERVRT